ncbi:unnamed protein product [Camellia sinensis]
MREPSTLVESKSKRRIASMEFPNLPRDVLFDILSRLPIKTLIKFRLVSKNCLSLIQHPHFITLHQTRSISKPTSEDNHIFIYYESIDYTKQFYSVCSSRDSDSLIEHKRFEFPFKSFNGYVRIVGSSNGLVCLFDTNYFSCLGNLFLWNPIVGKFKKLPDSHLSCRFRDTFSHMVVGFVFVYEINEFKVVEILYDSDREAVPDVLVYSLEANSWRKVEAIAPCYMPNCWCSNVCVNGSVHWLALKRPGIGFLYDSIMSFDMSNEVFREIGLPDNRNGNFDRVDLCVSASGDSLSLFYHFNDRWEVWLMKDYGVVGFWMKQFDIAEPQVSVPLNFMSGGDVLLVMKSGKLALHDPENQQMKDVEICGLPSSFRVVTYASSLVLLNGREKFLGVKNF